ncbi:MAG: DUF4239 domain-containing protein [Candidatus Obscuribacterales bacterium]|nr:DUF4239 domain-containing protein [Candidatus Obscuribacterales bacterium]
MDSYIIGAATILMSCVFSVFGLLITRKFFDMDKLKASHDVGGYLISVVGTLYAVLLGLVVVDSMQKFQDARDVTEKEATALADVFVLAGRLPEPKSKVVRNLCRDYVDLVMDREWQAMDDGKYSPEARLAAVDLMKVLIDFEPTTENQKALYPQMVSDVSQVWQSRRSRVSAAVNGLPEVEWITLLVGGAVTVFFTYFFCLENLKLQIVMTVMVAMLISLNLDLILLFAYPFSGDLRVGVDAFALDRDIFDHHQDGLGTQN